MNTERYKKPDLNRFRKVVSLCNGNLTKVANVLGVARSTIWTWTKNDREFANVIKDERGKMFDDCLMTARTLAMGIPAYENVYDENGDIVLDSNGKPKKVFSHWEEHPDAQMLKYLMSKLGKNEGFSDSPLAVSPLDDNESDGTVNNGVPIRVWIEKMNQGESE